MAKKTIVTLLFLIPILFIFKNWFIFPFLSGHDWPYFFKETLSDYSFFPPAWSPTLGIGLGGEMTNYGLGTFIYALVSLFVNSIGLPWELVYKIFIFGLFLILSVFSSVYLLRTVLKNPGKLQLLLSVLIFSANTYILMVLDGGQMGVALAYSISPLVLGTFINLVNNFVSISPNFKFHSFGKLRTRISNFKFPILASLVLTIQIMFDFRIAVLTTVIGLFYAMYYYFFIERFELGLFVKHCVLTGFIILGFNIYWVFPIVALRSLPSQELLSSLSSVSGFQFFSFATFSQTLSLLQPNWPENIFGKVYFMRSEFIILPVLAYLGLLFIKTKALKNAKQYAEHRRILFFALLGLVGAFLAKGANPPFGEINTWLFTNVPFLYFFRDSTKFYLLTMLSYSVLIPFTVYSIKTWLSSKLPTSPRLCGASKTQNYLFYLVPMIAILYLLFLIRPIFLDKLNGTFKRHEISKEYLELKDFLNSQKDFSRTLWIPRQDRYNFYSCLHPAVSGEDLFSATNSAEIIRKLKMDQTRELLSNFSIKYIIIPFDSFGEIFVKDRKYNEKEYSSTVNLLNSINWLKKIEDFGNIIVYETPDHKDHFWLNGQGKLSYTAIGPSEYEVKVSAEKASKVIFTEAYNPYWITDTGSDKLTSKKTEYNANSFLLEKGGVYELKVYFSKQKYYNFGKLITLLFIVAFSFTAIFLRKKTNL
ncbi:MAG: hypothetical protein ABH816_02500 [Candidatus Levyibacteriota bacterium]